MTLYDAYGESIIRSIKEASDEELEAIDQRPFKPTLNNQEFDFEKWCAKIERTRRKLNS